MTVSDFAFSSSNLVVGLGATVRWRFPDNERHDVTLADGPDRLRLRLARRTVTATAGASPSRAATC